MYKRQSQGRGGGDLSSLSFTQSMHLFILVSYSMEPAHNFCPLQPIIITTDIFMLPEKLSTTAMQNMRSVHTCYTKPQCNCELDLYLKLCKFSSVFCSSAFSTRRCISALSLMLSSVVSTGWITQTPVHISRTPVCTGGKTVHISQKPICREKTHYTSVTHQYVQEKQNNTHQSHTSMYRREKK